MLRRLIKTGIASAAHRAGADRLFAARAGVVNLPLVIGYHRVVQDFRASRPHSIEPMLISARTFERHLDWIGRRFQFVTLDDLAAWAEGSKRFDKPAAAITFDDGYRDVYHYAMPILRKKGVPAAMFVVTDLVGTSRLQNHDELYLLMSRAYTAWRNPAKRLLHLLEGLKLPTPLLHKLRPVADNPLQVSWILLENLAAVSIQRLTAWLRDESEVPTQVVDELRAVTWDMLREMSCNDITIGAHSRTHARLPNETWEKLLDETCGSRQAAERELGLTISHFAYPGGGFNATVVEAVAAAGYRCAYTSCHHRDIDYPALTIPRRLLWENSGLNAFGGFSPSLMSCQINGMFDLVARCSQPHGP
ncbi:MAG TPA: polysaccharide deacetylase family protein [Burkholderiales bacterium]|nr:polysaccharide deacetylase family protein [Burkholderiales bacterium]